MVAMTVAVGEGRDKHPTGAASVVVETETYY